MTGLALARELIAIKPDIPILICTGFSEKIDRKIAADMGVKGLLMKPVLASELAGLVRKALDDNQT